MSSKSPLPTLQEPVAQRTVLPKLKSAGIFCAVVLLIGLAVIVFVFDQPLDLVSRNWVITPIAILAAGFANATAVGGGFLFVPLFIFGFGLTSVETLKLSLASQTFGMTSGAIGWSRTFFEPKALLLACLGSGVGMLIGTYFWILPNHTIKLVFGWVSILIGVAIVIEMKYGSLSSSLRIERDSPGISVIYTILCVGGGLVTAWVSIGIGEVVALYLLFVYRTRIETAIATGVAALAFDSILGFTLHIERGGIEWQYLAFTAPGALIGGRFGARIGRWLEQATQSRRPAGGNGGAMNHSPLKWVFAGVVLLDGIVMLVQTHLG